MNEISIKGIDKAELLAALFNRSHQQGMGFMNAAGRTDMTVEQAKEVIEKHYDPETLYFDYLRGRVLKVGIAGDTLRTALYNRDVGEGAAEFVVDSLRNRVAAA